MSNDDESVSTYCLSVNIYGDIFSPSISQMLQVGNERKMKKKTKNKNN